MSDRVYAPSAPSATPAPLPDSLAAPLHWRLIVDGHRPRRDRQSLRRRGRVERDHHLRLVTFRSAARPARKVSSHAPHFTLRTRAQSPAKYAFACEDTFQPANAHPNRARKSCFRMRSPISHHEPAPSPPRKTPFAYEEPFRPTSDHPIPRKSAFACEDSVRPTSARPVPLEKVPSHAKTHFALRTRGPRFSAFARASCNLSRAAAPPATPRSAILDRWWVKFGRWWAKSMCG